MEKAFWELRGYVNCRIGSLEIGRYGYGNQERVNCRIGSLEIVDF